MAREAEVAQQEAARAKEREARRRSSSHDRRIDSKNQMAKLASLGIPVTAPKGARTAVAKNKAPALYEVLVVRVQTEGARFQVVQSTED